MRLSDEQSVLWTRRAGWLLIAALTALLYLGALDAPFVYDDKIEVVGNPTIRDLSRWRDILLYNTSRALLVLTYALNFDRFALEPLGYHVTSLVIHLLGAGAAMLLGESVGRLAGQPRPLAVALCAAGLWAVHPMATEGVTYITGRSESLCALLGFSALYAWAQALQADTPRLIVAGWRLLGTLAFLGAALSKEVGAMVPLAALALEVLLVPAARRQPRRLLWYLPLAALLGAAVYARLHTTGALLPREVERPLAVQLSTQAWVWLRYLQLWLAPVGQTIYHHVPDIAPASARGVGGGLGGLALLGGGLWWGRRNPAAGWALLAGALFLLPSSSFVPLKESMAEHRAYQTGLWLLLALGWSIPAAWQRRVALGVPVLAVVLGAATVQRNRVWSSEVALWQEAVDHHPDNPEAWYGLGDARRFARDFTGAVEAYQIALDRDPTYLDAWDNLGKARAMMGDSSGARAAWQAALTIKPSHCEAHHNLGELAYWSQDWDVAIAEYRSSLAYCPDNVKSHYGLGNIYFEHRRDRTRAAHHYGQILELDPDFVYAEKVRQRLLDLTW